MFVSIQWDKKTEAVASPEEFDSLLDRVTPKRPRKKAVTFMVQRRNGDSLLVALAAPESYLAFTPAHHGAPCFQSIGDPNCEGTFVFFIQGHWTEMHRCHAISPQEGREAAQLFVRMDKGLPPNIAWVMYCDD